MELEYPIVDPIHIFDKKKYITKKYTGPKNIHLLVEHKDTHELYYFIQKGKQYDTSTKNSFIKYLEKSIELIHPIIINLSGYSIEKPYLYYKVIEEPLYINNIKLTDENIQKVLIGMASGLSYLSSKGYYFTNFSFNSIIFDKKCFPKFIDYIDFNEKDKYTEKDMIKQYANLIQKLLKKKFDADPSIPINDELKSLIERCQHQKEEEIPNFKDFINFFKNKSYRGNFEFVLYAPFQKYIEILNQDKFVFNEDISKKFKHPREFDSLEQACFYFFRKNIKKFNLKQIFILNSIPEYYIKPLHFFCYPLSKKILRSLYNENISMVLPNWKKINNFENNSFNVYRILMNHMKKLEKQRNEFLFFDEKAKKINYQIESIRIQAIQFLKKASEQSINAKIELASQYIKGNLLAINYEKASKILDSIPNPNELIIQMKKRIESSTVTIENVLSEIKSKEITKIEKAENNVIYMLYLGFAFYTGYNGYPIVRSLSIQYYKKAAKSSPDAMAFLGFLYYNGIFFPQNLRKAKKCFKCAADNGSLKGEIVDGLLRKHIWRSYMVDFKLNELFMNSMIPNDTLAFPKINYLIENDLTNDYSYELILKHEKDENVSLGITKMKEWKRNYEQTFSEKNILFSEKVENTKDVKKQMSIAKSYFYGENNYPVNYTKATQFFKLAAENGDSEAQWRFALLCLNSIGIEKDERIVEHYLQESSKQNNKKGKFYYAFYVNEYKQNKELYKKLIKECIDSNDLDAMYYNAICTQKIEDYKNVADKGHIDSFIHLIKLLKDNENEEYKNYLDLSVGLLNENFIYELIKFYEESKNYKQSNILIQLGVLLNYNKFDIFYIDHLLNGKGIEQNILRAKKLTVITFQKKDKIPTEYFEKFICLMIQILANNNEHQKAYDFLIQYQYQITEKSREDFHKFYEKFDKNLARLYSVPACFFYEDFKICHDLLMDLFNKKTNEIFCYGELLKCANKGNSYANAILGKIYKRGKIKVIIRDLRKAIKFFSYSADKKCPLGCYYLGKEYFYGRYLNQNFKKAIKYLYFAINDDEEPRAGFYLYKILSKYPKLDETIDPIEMLKIGVKYGHKRALFKYGQILYSNRFESNEDKRKAEKLIQQACIQGYKKAKRFCMFHDIPYKNIDNESDSSINEDDTNFVRKSSVANQNVNEFGLIVLNEDDKVDEVVIKKDELSIESSAIENSSIIDIEEDYYSSSQSEDMKNTNVEENKNESNLNNLKNDKNFPNLRNIKDENDNSFDFEFWDK